MAWIHNFLTEASYLREALCLWIATIAVVAVASGVHYLLASGDRSDLRKRSKDQQALQEPEDSNKSAPGTI
jgi:hypothetical protein